MQQSSQPVNAHKPTGHTHEARHPSTTHQPHAHQPHHHHHHAPSQQQQSEKLVGSKGVVQPKSCGDDDCDEEKKTVQAVAQKVQRPQRRPVETERFKTEKGPVRFEAEQVQARSKVNHQRVRQDKPAPKQEESTEEEKEERVEEKREEKREEKKEVAASKPKSRFLGKNSDD